MNSKKLRGKGPESIIQDSIIKALEARGWFVIVTNGNIYQQGLPDLMCYHKAFGQRFIEVKNPYSYRFTPAQLICFPKIIESGVGVWVLTSADPQELEKLMRPCNFAMFYASNGAV